MPWLENTLQRIKAPFTPDPAVATAHAVELFAQVARVHAPGHDVQEQAWLGLFLSRMREVEACSAQRAWLDAVESNGFPLDATDQRIALRRTALIVDIMNIIGKPGVLNGRTLWCKFVCDAIVLQQWDISRWPQKKRWFNAILVQTWESQNLNNLQYQAYAQELATGNVWARDALLAHRALYVYSTKTLDAMLVGPANIGLPFITALVTSSLRIHQRAPAQVVSQLHREIYAAWPKETAQLEATMRAHAMMEETSLAERADMAKSMEIGDKGYSAYFSFYAQSIQSIIHSHLGQSLDVLELPLLD